MEINSSSSKLKCSVSRINCNNLHYKVKTLLEVVLVELVELSEIMQVSSSHKFSSNNQTKEFSVINNRQLSSSQVEQVLEMLGVLTL